MSKREPKTDWSDLFKIKIANSDESMLKHEVVKLILVMKLINKFKKEKRWIRVYTEFALENRTKPDVYFENLRTKECIAFEIQRNYTRVWLAERQEKYKDYDPPFFKTFDFIPIDLNDFPNDIEEINKKLDEYI